MAQKILLLYTGGTIGMVRSAANAPLKPFDFSNLLKQIPELSLLDCEITPKTLDKPLDSSDIQPDNWISIAQVIEENYNDFDGFVILHGTDTMAYTASALSFIFENLKKPIILTGSQLPIGDLRTDAKENLITALHLASIIDEKNPLPEVCVYFEYKLYRGNRVTKISAENFKAFASPNYPTLADSGVHLHLNKEVIAKTNHFPTLFHHQFQERIMLIKLFPGMQNNWFDFIIEKDIKGLIIETYGSGNAPSNLDFLKGLERIVAHQIPILNITQCYGGSVQQGLYANSKTLAEIGIISGNDLTTEAAIAKMMFLLALEDKQTFDTLITQDLRGEMSVI